MDGNELDRAWAERFFARQREEILAAVRTERARRRARRAAGLGLAAAALLLVAALGPFLRVPSPGPGGPGPAEPVTVATWQDPLAAYDPWDEAEPGLDFPDDAPGAGLARFLAGEDPFPTDTPQEAPPASGGARRG